MKFFEVLLKKHKIDGSAKFFPCFFKYADEMLVAELIKVLEPIWGEERILDECEVYRFTRRVIDPYMKSKVVSLVSITSNLAASTVFLQSPSTSEGSRRGNEAGFRLSWCCIELVLDLRKVLIHKRFRRPPIGLSWSENGVRLSRSWVLLPWISLNGDREIHFSFPIILCEESKFYGAVWKGENFWLVWGFCIMRFACS